MPLSLIDPLKLPVAAKSLLMFPDSVPEAVPLASLLTVIEIDAPPELSVFAVMPPVQMTNMPTLQLFTLPLVSSSIVPDVSPESTILVNDFFQWVLRV